MIADRADSHTKENLMYANSGGGGSAYPALALLRKIPAVGGPGGGASSSPLLDAVSNAIHGSNPSYDVGGNMVTAPAYTPPAANTGVVGGYQQQGEDLLNARDAMPHSPFVGLGGVVGGPSPFPSVGGGIPGYHPPAITGGLPVDVSHGFRRPEPAPNPLLELIAARLHGGDPGFDTHGIGAGLPNGPGFGHPGHFPPVGRIHHPPHDGLPGRPGPTGPPFYGPAQKKLVHAAAGNANVSKRTPNY